MTTLLDALDVLGRGAWEPVWAPVLAWTALALPLWLLLEATDRLHPRTEYRLLQVILATLPIGLFALAVRVPEPIGVDSSLSTFLLPVIEVSGVPSPESGNKWTLALPVGLFTAAASIAGLVGLIRLAFDAGAAFLVCRRGTGSPDSIQTTADQLADTMGIQRPVHVRLSPETTVPLTIGGLGPTILIPPHLLDDPDALRMTLLHEYVHVRRYDDVTQLFERIIAALFVAHPLVGRLRRQIAEARERACDAAVLEVENTDPADYARLLVRFTDGRPLPIAAAFSLFSSSSSIKTRLTAMHASAPRWIRSARSRGFAIVAAGLLLIVGTVACSDSLSPSAGNETTSKEAQSSPVTPVTDAEKPPKMTGGMETLREAIEYPEAAKDDGIEGRVLVEFVVTASGETRDVAVKEGVHETLDTAAVQAVRSVQFEPGREDGDPVPVQMALPLNFRIPDDGNEE